MNLKWEISAFFSLSLFFGCSSFPCSSLNASRSTSFHNYTIPQLERADGKITSQTGLNIFSPLVFTVFGLHLIQHSLQRKKRMHKKNLLCLFGLKVAIMCELPGLVNVALCDLCDYLRCTDPGSRLQIHLRTARLTKTWKPACMKWACGAVKIFCSLRPYTDYRRWGCEWNQICWRQAEKERMFWMLFIHWVI